MSVRTVIENYYLRKEMSRAGDFPLTTVSRKIVAEKNIGEKIALGKILPGKELSRGRTVPVKSCPEEELSW